MPERRQDLESLPIGFTAGLTAGLIMAALMLSAAGASRYYINVASLAAAMAFLAGVFLVFASTPIPKEVREDA